MSTLSTLSGHCSTEYSYPLASLPLIVNLYLMVAQKQSVVLWYVATLDSGVKEKFHQLIQAKRLYSRLLQ